MADANLDTALPFLVNAGIQKAGQTCLAASRIVDQRPVYDKVLRRMTKRHRALLVGPVLTDPDVGPLISQRQLEGVLGCVSWLNPDVSRKRPSKQHHPKRLSYIV